MFSGETYNLLFLTVLPKRINEREKRSRLAVTGHNLRRSSQIKS